MTIQEFDALKAGDRVDGRNYGDGTVEQNGEVLMVRWDRNGSISWAFDILRTLWGSFDASPMRSWFQIN